MLRNAHSRLVLFSVVLSSGIAALVLGVVYVATKTLIETEIRRVVEAELAGLEDDYRRHGAAGLAAAIESRLAGSERREAIYLLTDEQGRRIVGNLAAWPPTIEPGGGWVELDLIRSDNEQLVPVAAASLSLLGQARLLVGRDASSRNLFDKILWQSAGWSLALAIALSIATGWLLTRLVFSRIADISQTAKRIMSGELNERIPVRGTNDEFERLAHTLNDMLDRNVSLVENLRLTTNSMSHDLRSPLTRLRSLLETMTVPDKTSDEYTAGAQRALGEIDRLLVQFNNLNEIARAEARLARDEFELEDVSQLIADTVELYLPLALEKQIDLVATGQVHPVKCHRALLLQAITNLIENSLRFTPQGGKVAVEISEGENEIAISVVDSGPGIPDDFLSQAAKPFSTRDPSRTDGGFGLGLALAEAVARLHEGALSLTNCTPGLNATLTISR